METFMRLADNITEFECDYNGADIDTHTKHTLSLQQDDLKSYWRKAKVAYEELLSSDKATADEMASVRKKYKSTYAIYLRCMSNMATRQETFTKSEKTPVEPSEREHSIRLPPCDTEVFTGDYLSWPTFRDMFTAIYILNRRLTPVEKLFHLVNKTKGEARDIVEKSPLTNEGFDTAWKNLCERYENKRILVNSQLQILFNLEKVESECGSAIKTLQRQINNCLASLKSHKIDTSNWDAIITYLCSTKLPESTLGLWEQSIDHKVEISKWEDMDKFLSNRFQTLETVSGFVGTASPQGQKPQTAKKANEPPAKKLGTYQAKVTKLMCTKCKSTRHKLRACTRFLRLTPEERVNFIKSNQGCLNCLSPGHTVTKCPSAYDCSKCHSRHNTLLHIETRQNQEKNNTTHYNMDNGASTSTRSQGRREANDRDVKSCHVNSSAGVLLGTARVTIRHNGEDFPARALIDSGSECSFMTERLKRRIHLPAKKMNARVSGITNAVSAQVKEASNIELRSTVDLDFSLTTDVLILTKLTGKLPSCHVDAMTMQAFSDLVLADNRFYVNEEVDIILGGDVYPQIILGGLKKNGLNTLLAQETVFGWILTGHVEPPNPATNIVSFYSEVALDKELTKFWELENLPKQKSPNADDKYCEKLYKETTHRNEDGKYVVSLPFRQEYPDQLKLGGSLKRACSQFFRNETRLGKDPELGKEYKRVLSEYETLGHMEKITAMISAESCDNYFLPHHAVVKAESTTTKVRVVFNASSPTANGTSLNDILLPGPVLQADLPVLILRWRLYRYVFNSDIEKMYRQIWMNENHSKFQRIIYRSSPQEPIGLYELKTVTFGVNCAPYLAIRTLLQLADDVETSFPTASNILREGMYVDDVLAGGHTLASAIHARDEIRQVLHSAGFPLRKWTSNSEEILHDIPKADRLHEDFLAFEDTSTVKALGIRWNAHSDLFYFKAGPLDDREQLTKRAILSAIAKLFDPLGWLAPMVIVAKILMQNIWLEGTDWDEPVSSTTLERWGNFKRDYNEIDKIRIPRWVNFSPEEEIEIHGFCDASEKAYAAAVYMRVKRGDQISVNLLLAKTRVAPVKTISLPRLELCGAVLLAEILESIFQNIKLGQAKQHLWTDSTIVLAWIRKPPCSWSTFVAHRITKIIDLVGSKDWYHVNSESNPADLGSRGIPATDLVNNSLWWQGPSWLQEDKSGWPAQETEFHTSVEEKRAQTYAISKRKEIETLDRFSDLPRALRVLSYIMRFFRRTHPTTKASFQEKSCLISSDEIKTTTQVLIKLYQKQHYFEEYVNLKKGTAIDRKSEILALNPFLDKDDIMRTGGRLGASEDLAYNERHPIILPYNCRLTRLVVQMIHKISLHGENQLMLRLIRSQYWIPNVKNMIRAIIYNCKICTIYKKRVQTQLMGDLPRERTTFSRAFTNTGVDFAGPFDIKSFRGRGCRLSKGYVCLFVCFTTKAIHLEATSDLSTPSFLAALSRFIARRGCPKNIYSDNGTNFVGASRSLRSEFKNFISDARDQAISKYSHQLMTWHFIPAGAPHMGGLWEAGVKSFKNHFKKVASPHRFTHEEFHTLLCRIEACLNSRPLSPASNDPSDLEPLTPGHFLTGSHLMAPPEPNVNESSASMINRWQKLKALHHTFCKRWKVEYLTELQKRVKWKQSKQNIKVGDLVVIKEDNLSPNEWRLGRVTNVHPGEDNRVRVVDLMTEKGQIRRPLVKLILLPTDGVDCERPDASS